MLDTSNRETITVTQAAKRLGIGLRLAYELARCGELPACRKLGNRYIILKAELDWYLKGKAAEAEAAATNGHRGMVW